MHDKRRWLPSWQRVELVELWVEHGFTRRQAAAWRRVSVATVQYWIGRYRAASDADQASGAWRTIARRRLVISPGGPANASMTASVKRASGPAGAPG